MNQQQNQTDRKLDTKSFIVSCADLPVTAALGWLALGWKDFRAALRVSLIYGLFVFIALAAIAWAAWSLGGYVLLLSTLSGFIFIAPLLAFALYSVSRQLCEGKEPSLRHTFLAMRRPAGHAGIFALVLLVIFLVWARAGLMVHIFFPVDGHPELRDIVTFLTIGSAVGSIFAAFTFATCVFSLPMLANRDVDIVTAVVSSINAVMRNKFAMLYWAVTIVILTLIGFATAMLGLIVIIPWLAYASWHGYRESLDVSAWPVLKDPDQ